MRLGWLVGLGLALGCGADPDAACDDYVNAWKACARAAYADNDEGYENLTAPTATACDPYRDLDGADARAAVDLLRCEAWAYEDGDCTSSDGFTAAAVAAAECSGQTEP